MTETNSEFDIDAHAELLAAKAVKGFVQAIYRCGEYLGDVCDSDQLVFDVIDRDDYPTEAIFDAVYEVAVTTINELGGPWISEQVYDALTGADDGTL
jgi:hypothetical protein